jgi:cytochrome P450
MDRTKETEKPTVEFDQNSAEFAADPWSKYQELRSDCPVAHTDSHGGFWVVSKYDDVVKVARDDITFSSCPTTVIPDSGVYNLIPLQSDPPDLQRYREALLPFFTPTAIASYAPRIRKFTNDCIDTFVDRGHCELVTELANPVPSMTALEFIGFDPRDWHDFAGPMHQLSYYADGSPERAQALADLGKMDDVIAAAIDDRRKSLSDDAITALVNYKKDGVAFSDIELHGLVKMLLFGGLDTTMAATSNALLYLSDNPGARQKLIDDSGLIPLAVEEFLRFEAPVHAFSRNVTTATQIGGQKISAGEKVYMLWASANRDPDQFENPDEVILDRRPNRHLTFGVGGHRCLGATLARMEMQIILEEVLRRIPDFCIDADKVRHPITVTIIWGRTSLPATFTPRN